MGDNKPVIAVTIILAFVVFGTLQVLNGLAADPEDSGGLFLRGIGNVSSLYPLDITPAGVTFAIWGVIYIWQAAIIIYSLINICRQGPEGPVYTSPAILPASFYVFYILNNVCNIVWLFLWDRLYLKLSAVFLFLIAISLYICIAISYRSLDKYRNHLIKTNRQGEIWAVIFIVQNGIQIYATWTTIASLINLGTALSYSDQAFVSPKIASTIGLGILVVEFTVFVGTDLSIVNRYSRYVFTPYFVVPVALTGIIAKNWDPSNPNSVFTAVILGVSLIAAVLKVARLAGWGQSGVGAEKIVPTTSNKYKLLK